MNVLSRAVDGALNILNATAGDSDMENVQWRIRETKRVLSAALREVTVAPEAGSKAEFVSVKVEPNAHECAEWLRMSQAAASVGRADVAKRFLDAASEVAPMALWRFDYLQAEYRQWLVRGTFLAPAL